MKLDEQTKNELFYKIEAVKQFLIHNGGYEHKLYNHLCPSEDTMPDSNIVEYLDDIESIITFLLSPKDNKIENEYF